MNEMEPLMRLPPLVAHASECGEDSGAAHLTCPGAATTPAKPITSADSLPNSTHNEVTLPY
jgi:hypothetical protein